MRTFAVIIFMLVIFMFAYFSYASSETCSSYKCGEGYMCYSYCTDREETPACSYDKCACVARIQEPPLPPPPGPSGYSISCTGADVPKTTTAYGACGSVTDYGTAKCFSKPGTHPEKIGTDIDCVQEGTLPNCRYNEKN